MSGPRAVQALFLAILRKTRPPRQQKNKICLPPSRDDNGPRRSVEKNSSGEGLFGIVVRQSRTGIFQSLASPAGAAILESCSPASSKKSAPSLRSARVA